MKFLNVFVFDFAFPIVEIIIYVKVNIFLQALNLWFSYQR